MSDDLSNVELTYVDSFAKVQDFMRWLGERRPVLGFDTETSGFMPERDVVRLFQFGDAHHGWAFPWADYRGIFREVIDTYEGEFVAHNSKFDIRFTMHALGRPTARWPWDRTHDTMTLAHLADPLRPKGLKPLSARLIDPSAAASQRSLHELMTKNKWTWASVPSNHPYYWGYAAMDPVLTARIYEKLKNAVPVGPYDLEMATTRVIAGMEERGARVDVAYSREMREKLLTYAAEVQNYLMEKYGPQGLRGLTPLSLLKFFNDNGVAMLNKKTAGGAQSMDKEVLESVEHELAQLVLRRRYSEKMASTYFDNFITSADADNVVHPNIWTMGTRTGRMSITDPALQTLPRGDALVRNAFVPREGNVLITCDLDQVEARLMAHFSKDAGLIAAFNSKEDFFCTIASGIFGEPIKKGDPRRQLTKNVVYGKLYGAGVAKMAATAKVDEAIMKNVDAGFSNQYPGVRALQNAVGRGASVTTPTGRELPADKGKEYTLVNYLIQGHAAEYLKNAMVNADTVLPGALVLPIHDELLIDVPADDAQDALHALREAMTDRESYAVPITAGGDILTERWGQKYE